MKQTDIKRQHKEAYNTQTRQYKALKEKIRLDFAQLASSNGSRSELDGKLKSLKDDQRRKFDLLYQRYEETIQKMLDHQNFKLNTDQERERTALKVQLDEDQRNLLSLQEESRHRMEQQHIDERKQLERNIDDRFLELNKQVEQRRRLSAHLWETIFFRWNKSWHPTMKIERVSSPFFWRNNAGNYRRSIRKSPISESMWRISLSQCKIYISFPPTLLRFQTRRWIRPATITIIIITIIIERRWSVCNVLTVPIRSLPIQRRRQLQQRISRSTCHLFSFGSWIQWFHLVVVIDSVVRSFEFDP